MSPSDMRMAATEVQAILELAKFRLAAKEPLEAYGVFCVEVALSVASGLLDPVVVPEEGGVRPLLVQAPGALQ
ncbi:MAG: hypothetical protein QUV35_12235 [Hydrogenophaga sp.]|uniref:hypothetical protein n=1 Tax=Hydrogenophaga sp. TaxID=1904254 RepID=UPI002638B8CE|nr:hypothetical protein [Hydrogenophaga sp.]MDM7943388.1 hypothetical protein [Hydrogenophaga sp.]